MSTGGDFASKIDILLTDSRDLAYPKRSIFFAIKTVVNDGHKYIEELYRSGVRAFVVERLPEELDVYSEAVFLKVPDVVVALQKLVAHHRSIVDGIPVVGITGSSGKTIVKEWLYQLLNDKYDIVRSPRSYNSQIGVPLSVWSLEPSTGLGIFEAGVSRIGEMDALEHVIRPNIGVFTCINGEHDEGFSSMHQKCMEKVRLFRNCRHVIYCADDRHIRDAVEESCNRDSLVPWSLSDSTAALYISSVEPGDGGNTLIKYKFSGVGGDNHGHDDKVNGEITVPFNTRIDVENAIHCLAVCLCLGISSDYLSDRVPRLTKVDTRLKVIEGVNNCMIAYDAYTNDYSALGPTLDFMNRRRTARRSHTVILSDPQFEHQRSEDMVYEMYAGLLKAKGVSRVIGVGPGMCAHRHLFVVNYLCFESTKELQQHLSVGDFSNEFILLKGSPDFDFEKLSEMLEARHQETVLEVNLDAIVHNFNYYRSLLPQNTGLVGMVKASAYGMGALEVSKTLQSRGAAYLAVAVLDEGVTLREAGVTMPIMVLNPRVLNYRTLFSYNLEPEIYNFEILDQVIGEGKKCGVDHYPVHIKLDTGMHRLGFIEEELPRLLDIILAQHYIRVESVFSHLATADCTDQNEYTMHQLELFDRCYDIISNRLPYHVKKHILNTAGIQRFADGRNDDMARLGLGLYGIDPVEGISRNLRTVARLTTIVTALRRWPGDTSIGYSRRGYLKSPSVIATIPIGYADGLNRRLGNGRASFMVNGHRVPTVGNICMDSCMIDVTGIECSIGDTVEIFGPDVPVTEIAGVLDTIPYEVFTSVSTRVKRVYYRE